MSVEYVVRMCVCSSRHPARVGGEEAKGSALQRRVDSVLAATPDNRGLDQDLNVLMCALLENHETAAFIRFAVCNQMHAGAHTRTHMRTNTHKHTSTHTSTRTRARARAHTHTHTHRIWDLAQARNVEVSAAVREGMHRLHKRGKGRVPEGTLKLPDLSGKRLKAARRLHKICIGPVRGRT